MNKIEAHRSLIKLHTLNMCEYNSSVKEKLSSKQNTFDLNDYLKVIYGVFKPISETKRIELSI